LTFLHGLDCLICTLQGGDKMDMILLAVAEALLVVEHGCVDQAHDNIRSIIDGLWGARDPFAAQVPHH